MIFSQSHPHTVFHSLLSYFPEGPVEFTQPLQDQTVPTSANVTLECAVNKPNQKATWYKNGVEVLPDDKHVVEVEGVTHRLSLADVTPDETAEFVCKIADATCSAQVLVEGVFQILINNK